MSQTFFTGSTRKSEPKQIGELLTEFFQSDSPLARGYRKYLASVESLAEKGVVA